MTVHSNGHPGHAPTAEAAKRTFVTGKLGDTTATIAADLLVDCAAEPGLALLFGRN